MTFDLAEKLLHPLSVAEFLERHWERSPAHVRGDRAKVGALLGGAARMRSVFANVAQLRANFPDPGNRAFLAHRTRLAMDLPSHGADAALAAGATLTARHIEREDEGVRRLCGSLKSRLGFAGGVMSALWLSPSSRGAPVHFDGAAVLTLQIEGKKRWRVSREPALPWPMGITMGAPNGEHRHDYEDGGEAAREAWEDDIPAFDESAFLTADLEPGDLLFIPAGTWHKTEALGDGYSLALNTHFFPRPGFDLLAKVYEPLLRASPEWRSLPALGAMEDGSAPAELEGFLRARLAEMEDAIRSLKTREGMAMLTQEWVRSVADVEAVAEKVVHHLQPESDAPSVSRGDALRFKHGVPPTCLFTTDESGARELHFFHAGAQICFDEPALFPFALRLAQTDRFVAEDAMRWSDSAGGHSWDRACALLTELVAQGILERDVGKS